jgi:fructose-bisphosphate aldolase class I
MKHDTESTARALVADGKGILAADETPGTLTRRFDALVIRSTEQSRRAYREMLFTAPDAATFISGVIMQDETIDRRAPRRRRLPRCSRAGASCPGSRSIPA